MSTIVHTSVRYGYAPLMLLGINGAGIALAASGADKAWLLALLVAAIALSFAAERLLPYRSVWNSSHGDVGRDTAHTFVNETLILTSVAAIPALAALVPGDGIWPTDWPFVVQVLIAILVADFGITLTHYASHKIGLLWRFHAVHHSVTRFYGLNGLMKHPLHQTLEMTAGVTPLLSAGIPVPVAAALSLAVAVQLLLQHSNADYRVGPLKYVLALNEGHRFHHLKWAGIGDVNFGLFTLVWDHLLRTYSYDPARRFTSDDLGMAAKPDYPVGYLAQLAEPFTRHGACTTTSGEHTENRSGAASIGQAPPSRV
ncbi:sterol desaturase family protein [Nocardia amikacinitolerans]|uniref:sterol desaturase family protein n=1 Tax=Nocardia amikacinitolerans TaxID=756689 RepID=UPI0020A30FE9|nr:sterol desaturase family protein [Nocardia amikacinitolerans]MCP2288889.1 Sterol desaturase/sphingolipid hydroxylase, fatty acid hydroxylase superfamily [Nocardia amikacinitolerans]